MPEIAEREANGGSVDAGSSFVAFPKGGALCPGVGQARLWPRETALGEVVPVDVNSGRFAVAVSGLRDEMLLFTPS